MLKALKFVQGAIAKNTFHPELAHFYIGDGKIKSYNGALGLCSPIALDIEACPKAGPFVKAIQTCQETVAIHLTEAKRLAIKSGSFKAFIDCVETDLPNIEPEGTHVELNGEFLPAIKKLFPFIADDASRQWARGILFKGQSAFATNNICIVEHWLETKFPVEANVPQEALRELLRIGEEPKSLQVNETSMTFHFEDGKWLKTQLYETEWPDLSLILNKPSKQESFVENFFDAIENLLPFVNDSNCILFSSEEITTNKEAELGSSIALVGLPDECSFNAKQLLLLKSIANTIDFKMYPEPCLFYGDNIRGAIVGMQL